MNQIDTMPHGSVSREAGHAARILGRIGGSKRSPAKTRAARRNAKRPRLGNRGDKHWRARQVIDAATDRLRQAVIERRASNAREALQAKLQ